MQIRKGLLIEYGGDREDSIRLRSRSLVVRVAVVAAAMVVLSGMSATPQQSPPPRPPHPILLPEANHLPDVNDQMKMREDETKKQNFDAVNALRTQQIADDTAKLLILTKDLKVQMEKVGDEPLPPRLVREAEVIEILAHDVQTKMTLTVGAS